MTKLGLFEGYGIELEYMIVDAEDLRIRSISDQIMAQASGKITGDVLDHNIAWSNELVLHVIELKTNGPSKTLENIADEFHRSLGKINLLASDLSAQLLPTAMHPLMNPSEMQLWPHDSREVYDKYHSIFDCRGHGWSNLQSMHINLPFNREKEFVDLHAAIRFLLPILPALTASSPIVEGRQTGAKDNRLIYYQKNQARLPAIAGLVVPEPVESVDEYNSKILKPIYDQIAPYDPEQILRDDWLNSRGAITRFERQTIEIRVLDIQETPFADIAIADFIVSVLKRLIEQFEASNKKSLRPAFNATTSEELKILLDSSIIYGEDAPIVNSSYLESWGAPIELKTIGDLWKWIYSDFISPNQLQASSRSIIESILSEGTLSTRIGRDLGKLAQKSDIHRTYRKLSNCLIDGKLFYP